ncbi:TFC4 [Sanghuangporus sanghuang]
MNPSKGIFLYFISISRVFISCEDENEVEIVESSSSGSEYELSSAEETESIATESIEEDGDVQGSGEGMPVETQIEGDFDRLIGSIRGTDDLASSATLSKIWDAPSNAEAEEQFQADLRAASGIGRKRKGRGQGRRHRRGPVLSHQVRALIGEGNSAYVDGNLQEAIRIMTEVIRIEPRAASAWSVLATCYREMSEPTKALQVAIMGAHLRHDPDEWHELARQSRDAGQAQQALYCLAKTMRLDPANFDAIWDRASLAKEVGDLPAARNSYLAMLKRFPHDTGILTELRHILIESGDLKLCAKLYQDAFDHFTSTYPEGKVSEPVSKVIDPALTSTADVIPETPQAFFGEFSLMDILVLADLYNSLGWYDRCIKTIRAGCRWSQGRSKQKYWDTCPDDREYDVEGFVRSDDEDNLAIKQGFYPLDINARHRLAIARLKLGDFAEGRMHANIILIEDVVEFSPLFAEIADTFFECALYSEARTIYEMLGSDATTSSIHVLMQAAECRRNLGETNDAAEIYEHIIDADPSNDEAKMKLAEIYENSGQPRKALELVYQVINSRKRRIGGTKDGDAQDDGEEIAAVSLFTERKRGRAKQSSSSKTRTSMSRQHLIELEREKDRVVAECYEQLLQLQDPMRHGDTNAENEWLANAEKLIEMFRETRSLFVSRSAKPFRGTISARRKKKDDEEEMASRLEMEIEHEKEEREMRKSEQHRNSEVMHFRGIHFDEWLSLAMEYAFLLTRRDHFEEADDVLRHLMLSTVYSSQKFQDTLRLTLATCAVHAREFETTLEMFRRLMLNYQFNNELIRLFFATLASGLSQTDQVINNSFQKFVLREMRTHANAVEGKAHWLAAKRRFMSGQFVTGKPGADEVDDDNDSGGEGAELLNESEDGESVKPKRSNPVLPTLYGQSLILARSYQGALFYLLHAYDYFPNDPLICMTLAISSLGRAMQRQSDNRNFLITQAMSFMTKYRVLRGPGESDPHADEIEYNYGRAFHQIGLLSYAVKHYERVLDIVKKRQASDKNDVGVSREAAYNLCLIYVTTGATHLAKAVTRRWLSI